MIHSVLDSLMRFLLLALSFFVVPWISVPVSVSYTHLDVYKRQIASSYVSDISNDISALQEKESFPTITSTSITDVQLVKDGTTIDMAKEVTQEPATEGETPENAYEEAETGSEVSEEETTKAVSDSTEEGLTEEESTVERCV